MIPKNIISLENKVRTVYTELGYSESTVESKLFIAKTLIRLHNEKGKLQWSDDVIAGYINHQEARYQNGKISKRLFTMRKTATEYFKQIYNIGTIICKRQEQIPPLPDSFERILTEILGNEERNLKFRKRLHVYSIVFFR